MATLTIKKPNDALACMFMDDPYTKYYNKTGVKFEHDWKTFAWDTEVDDKYGYYGHLIDYDRMSYLVETYNKTENLDKLLSNISCIIWAGDYVGGYEVWPEEDINELIEYYPHLECEILETVENTRWDIARTIERDAGFEYYLEYCEHHGLMVTYDKLPIAKTHKQQQYFDDYYDEVWH